MTQRRRTAVGQQEDLASWLGRLGLAEYYAAFRREGYDMDTLRSGLTPSDFKALGIERAGHQKKMLVALEELSGGSASSRSGLPQARSIRNSTVRRSKSTPNGAVVAPRVTHTPPTEKRRSDWETATDDKGRVYYWNPKTRETSWSIPTDMTAPPPPAEKQPPSPQKSPRRETLSPTDTAERSRSRSRSRSAKGSSAEGEGSDDVDKTKPVRLIYPDKVNGGKMATVVCVHKARKLASGTSYVRVALVDGKGKTIKDGRTGMLSHVDQVDFSEAFVFAMPKGAYRIKVEMVDAASDKVLAGMHFDVPKKWEEFLEKNATIETGTWYQIGQAAQIRLILLNPKLEKKDENGEQLRSVLDPLLRRKVAGGTVRGNTMRVRSRSNAPEMSHAAPSRQVIAKQSPLQSHREAAPDCSPKKRAATVRVRPTATVAVTQSPRHAEAPTPVSVPVPDSAGSVPVSPRTVITAGEVERCLDLYFGRVVHAPDSWTCSVVSLNNVGSSPTWKALYHVTVEWDSVIKGAPKRGRSNFTVGRSTEGGAVTLISKGHV